LPRAGHNLIVRSARGLAIALGGAVLVICGRVDASDMQAREDQLKAAYLFNFVKFVEWPAAIGETLTVCFIGGGGVQEALAINIDKKRVGARNLAARQVDASSSALKSCNVLYVDSASLSASDGLLRSVQTALTVSDASGFARNGGMIELFTESNRLRFSVNIENTRRAGLKISSSLLQLAATVEKE
jgi:hypothetical protein